MPVGPQVHLLTPLHMLAIGFSVSPDPCGPGVPAWAAWQQRATCTPVRREARAKMPCIRMRTRRLRSARLPVFARTHSGAGIGTMTPNRMSMDGNLKGKRGRVCDQGHTGQRGRISRMAAPERETGGNGSTRSTRKMPGGGRLSSQHRNAGRQPRWPV
jgi:hypothetical protein